MSLIKFKYNNKIWAIVRNHKCSTTTMLSYVAQALWNADPREEQFYRNFENNAPGVYIKRKLFDEYKEDLLSADIRIALWRDPIDKFVSGYYHTMSNVANRELWIKDPSIKNFIKDYDYYITNDNVSDHRQSNTARLGADKSAYTHIFNYKHVHKIAELLKVPAHNTHHRKDSMMRLPPSKTDQLRIKQILLEDYVNGWH